MGIHMNPEILAQRLEAAAIHYQRVAKEAEEETGAGPAVQRVAAQLKAQAQECLDWAEGLRGEIRSIGFDGADNIELEIVGD